MSLETRKDMSFGVRKKGSWPTLHFIGWKNLEPFLGSHHKAALCRTVSHSDHARKESQYNLPGGGRTWGRLQGIRGSPPERREWGLVTGDSRLGSHTPRLCLLNRVESTLYHRGCVIHSHDV